MEPTSTFPSFLRGPAFCSFSPFHAAHWNKAEELQLLCTSGMEEARKELRSFFLFWGPFNRFLGYQSKVCRTGCRHWPFPGLPHLSPYTALLQTLNLSFT